MNSKSLRRLAGDHGSLHTAGLPPNYLFPPSSDGSADLTSLDVLLAGPVGTPYAGGVWRLHLDIPPSYPAAPPTAQFRTRLWHPNIDEATGAVCVETLKRDWSSSLKLRDVLVTISCLLIQPNPASALNEAAGQLASEDWDTYCRRAKLMTEIHAPVPGSIAAQVKEAQMRGEDVEPNAESPMSKTRNGGEDVDHAKALPSTSKRHVATEDEENTRQIGEIQELKSDPESDWIPGPNATSKAPMKRRENNAFGIKGLDDATQRGSTAKRIFVATGLAVGPAQEGTSYNTEPFTTVASKRGAQMSPAVNLRLPTAASDLASQIADTPEVLKYSHRNPFSTLQPNNQLHPLLREFSYSWEDARTLKDAEILGEGASKDRTRKRIASDELEAKRSWEMKRFKNAGLDLGRYNRGDFGPRIGVSRL
ncbi:hypothetical protein NX059_002627 [Plenodomus lindquistii]|nr:hypothetical protein NX059_002627 [Plenodomus lindquistii]